MNTPIKFGLSITKVLHLITFLDGHFVTGGTDGTLVFWKDHTTEKEAEERVAENQRIQEEQELSNMIFEKEFV